MPAVPRATTNSAPPGERRKPGSAPEPASAPKAARSRPRPAGPDYRRLFESAPGMFLVMDPDLTIVAASDAYLSATMTHRDRILGRNLFEVFPDNPDDPGATGVGNLRASLDRVRSSLVPDTMAVQKYDIRRPEEDGGGFEERFWSPVNSPVLGADGALAYIIHRVEDVTEFVRLKNLGTEQQRLTEQLQSRSAEIEAEVYRRAQDIARSNRELHRANLELERAQAFLDSLIENLPHMVFVKDAKALRFVRVNRAGEELLGYRRADLIGRGDQDFFSPEKAEALVARDREAIEGRRVVDIHEEPIETARLGRRILHTKMIPILDEHGAPAYLLGISEDITERKQAEDEVVHARREAERANQAKTEFLSRMSHELRTPLNAILGFSQLLEMDDLGAEQAESVAYITQAGRHLLELINEILDLSRIESGNLTVSPEPVAMSDVIAEAVALARPLARDHAIELDTMDATCDRYVLADRQRLRQVMLNLLSNAIKYNRRGGSITLRCASAEQQRLRISISDTGYGIAPEDLDRVFRPFERLGAELRAVEGTGIGLPLTQGLVLAMGGSIGVESELDIGSTFWVELPVTEGPIERYERTSAAAPEMVAAGRPRRLILIIEDNVSNLRLVERIVSREPGLELVTAMLGREGVELARGRRVDLILLDLHLPDLPGHEVLRVLKSYPETRGIPVVILSADATSRQVRRLIQAGAFGYLTKPIDVDEFLRTIDRATAEPS